MNSGINSGSFIYSGFVCDDCNTTNFEEDVYYDDFGDYQVLCGSCGGTEVFGNIYEDKKNAAREAYNDMAMGK